MTVPPVPARPRGRARSAPGADLAATFAALASALFDQRCRGLGIAAFPPDSPRRRSAARAGGPRPSVGC
jgi:hypothetical protein